MAFTLRLALADTDHFETVLGLIEEAAGWLRTKDTNQWSAPWPDRTSRDARVMRGLAGGKTWIVWDGDTAAATVTMAAKPNPAVWEGAGDLSERAVYVDRLIVARKYAGLGLGAQLLDWAGLHARGEYGAKWIRIDAWTTNTALHEYCRRQGFEFCGMCTDPSYPSGALFQKRASQIAEPSFPLLSETPDRNRQPSQARTRAWPEDAPEADNDTSRREHADAAEKQAVTLLAERSFDQACGLLREAIALDPGRSGRILPDLDFLSGQPGEDSGRLAWRRGVWLALADASTFRPQDVSPVKVPKMGPAAAQAPAPKKSSDATRRPEMAGTELETAFVRLLERFFHLAAGEEALIVERLRRQAVGTQYGHDVQFDCTAEADRSVRCHVECKNYGRQLVAKDVADKIWQTRIYWQSKEIDHFVILSPHAGISNDLDILIQSENNAPSARFKIQIWGPEEGVRELFAIEPEAYRIVYGAEPPGVDTEKVVARWAARLKPVPKLPASLSGYLQNSRSHCVTGEERAHFERVFDHAIELEAADAGGVPLGRLRDVLDNWLDDPAQRTLLLLGEFGDGKSFESYRLTRRLATHYGADPAGYFPLRLPLRELRSEGSPQTLLGRRLQALDATVRQWEDLARTLVVLDGFDEMSVQIDHATVADNLRLVAGCLDYFTGSKILVTSRTHFFETVRDQARFLEQLEQPRVVRLVPIRRSKTSEHLDAYARRHRLSDKLQRMRRLYDPIGLAAKPLYLQMMKEALPALPDDHFDELVLYDTYVRDSLTRKARLLEDKNMRTLKDETLRGMTELLEAVAVELFLGGGEAVDLRTFGEGAIDIARVLWKMSEADASVEQTQDARARLAVRSLLKPAFKGARTDAWPVAFCHRSMFEYFLARAITKALGGDDLTTARRLLGSAILGPEIVHFITLLVRTTERTANVARVLETLTRVAAKGSGCGYLGGNAITLAFRIERRPAQNAWHNLDLSYADLSGADLSGSNFRGSLLRYVTLDNADLSYANLTSCDLTGVRLEETAQVIDVAPGRGEDRVLASYGDGSIREWRLGGSRPSSEKLLDGLGKLKTAAWGPHGDLVVVDGSRLLLHGLVDGKAVRQHELRIRSDLDSIRFTRGAVSFTCADKGHRLAISVDCQAATAVATVRLTSTGPVALAEGGLVLMPLRKNVAGLAQLHGADLRPVEIPVSNLTAAAMRHADPGEVRVVLADSQGHVTGLRVGVDGGAPQLGTQLPVQLQGGPVLSAAFLSPDTMVFGCSDRNLVICDWEHDGLRIRDRLKLTLRCAGVTIAGVQGDRERRTLEALRRRAEELTDGRGSGSSDSLSPVGPQSRSRRWPGRRSARDRSSARRP